MTKTIFFLTFFSLSLFLFLIPTVIFAQSNPSDKNLSQSIFLDKKIYTWTDRVQIKIIVPNWNTDPFTTEIIGDKEREFVKVATREFKLKPYRLIETEPNSGEFVGWITLTGFSHDVNGDKTIDTNPRTEGSGPFDGFLQSKRGDGITVTFETDKKVFSSATAQIKWNVGEISLDKESYFIDEKMKITVNDPDMNLNPDSTDELTITVSSDSDPSGFKTNAQETKSNSGIFETQVPLSLKKHTSTGTLYVLPTDSISIKYKDRTLPVPQSTTDVLTIEKTILFKDPIPPTSRIDVSNSYLKNNAGIPKIEPIVGRQVEVTASVENKQNYEQNIVYVVQIINEEGKVIKLSWLEGILNPYQTMVVGKQWVPEKAGNYLVETFVWKSLNSPMPLSPKISNYYQVFDE